MCWFSCAEMEFRCYWCYCWRYMLIIAISANCDLWMSHIYLIYPCIFSSHMAVQLLKTPLLWFCDQQDLMNNPAAIQTNSKYTQPAIMKCYFDWTGLTMPCVFDPDITYGWPKRVPVLRGLGETNALQMASHGPFLAWIWALPLPPPPPHLCHWELLCKQSVIHNLLRLQRNTGYQDSHVSLVYATEEWWHRPLGGFIHWKWHQSPTREPRGAQQTRKLVCMYNHLSLPISTWAGWAKQQKQTWIKKYLQSTYVQSIDT